MLFVIIVVIIIEGLPILQSRATSDGKQTNSKQQMSGGEGEGNKKTACLVIHRLYLFPSPFPSLYASMPWGGTHVMLVYASALWAVHGATKLRVFTVVSLCAAWNEILHT